MIVGPLTGAAALPATPGTRGARESPTAPLAGTGADFPSPGMLGNLISGTLIRLSHPISDCTAPTTASSALFIASNGAESTAPSPATALLIAPTVVLHPSRIAG